MLSVAAPQPFRHLPFAPMRGAGLMADDDTDEARLLGRALAALRDKAGLSQPQAAHNFGIESAAGWGKYELGKNPSIERTAVQRRLVAAVGASIEDLMLERARLAGSPPEPPRHGVADRARQFSPAPSHGTAPVFGHVAGHTDRVSLTSGTEIRWAPVHPAQRGYTRVGAVETVGESMYPRYKPRELAYFVFDLPPAKGDDVVVELTDGTALLKEYAGRTPERLILREFYPEVREIEVKLSEVRGLHAVVR